MADTKDSTVTFLADYYVNNKICIKCPEFQDCKADYECQKRIDVKAAYKAAIFDFQSSLIWKNTDLHEQVNNQGEYINYLKSCIKSENADKYCMDFGAFLSVNKYLKSTEKGKSCK